MPGKAQYNSHFHNGGATGRAPRGHSARPVGQDAGDNVVRFHGPGARVMPHATAAAPLPLAASSVVLHTDLECLPIELVASILWPYMNEVPRAWEIRNFEDFYKALADWNELESRAAGDALQLLSMQGTQMRVIWATTLGHQGRFADYRVAGLAAHASNQFWARRFDLDCPRTGAIAPPFVLELESLRVAMEVIMLRLYPVSLEKHIAFLKILDSMDEDKGFSDPQRAESDGRDLGLEGINFTLSKYPPVARNSMRMKVLANAARVLAQRQSTPDAAP